MMRRSASVALELPDNGNTRPWKKIKCASTEGSASLLIHAGGVSLCYSGLRTLEQESCSQFGFTSPLPQLKEDCLSRPQGLEKSNVNVREAQSEICEESVLASFEMKRQPNNTASVGTFVQRNGTVDSVEGKDEVVSTLYYYTCARPSKHLLAKLCFELASTQTDSSDRGQRVLGIVGLHDLGRCCYMNGRHAKALKYYREALLIVLEFQLEGRPLEGSLHAIGVRCIRSIAMVTFLQSLQMSQLKNPGISIEMSSISTNIRRIPYLRRNYGAGLAVCNQRLGSYPELVGMQQLGIAATTHTIGQMYHQLGRDDRFVEYYSNCVVVANGYDEASARLIAFIYQETAAIHHEHSQLQLARHFLHLALASQLSFSTISSRALCSILNRLGNVCYEMQDYVFAMKYFKKGLELEKSSLPSNHPHIVVTMTNIGHVHKSIGEFKKALKFYSQAYVIQLRNAKGANCPRVAETLSNIGLMHFRVRNYQAALECYQESLRIRREWFGTDDNAEIASTLNSIGLIVFQQDMFDMAKECFTRSLEIRKKLLGPIHEDVATLWYNIASVYFELGDDDRAIQLYKETLRIEKKALGRSHPGVVHTLQHMGIIFQQVGQLNEAHAYFLEALKIERNHPEHDTSVLIKILNLLGNFHLQQGNTSELMKYYVEASRLYESTQAGGNGQQIHNSTASRQARGATPTLYIVGYNYYSLSKLHPPSAAAA